MKNRSLLDAAQQCRSPTERLVFLHAQRTDYRRRDTWALAWVELHQDWFAPLRRYDRRL